MLWCWRHARYKKDKNDYNLNKLLRLYFSTHKWPSHSFGHVCRYLRMSFPHYFVFCNFFSFVKDRFYFSSFSFFFYYFFNFFLTGQCGRLANLISFFLFYRALISPLSVFIDYYTFCGYHYVQNVPYIWIIIHPRHLVRIPLLFPVIARQTPHAGSSILTIPPPTPPLTTHNTRWRNSWADASFSSQREAWLNREKRVGVRLRKTTKGKRYVRTFGCSVESCTKLRAGWRASPELRVVVTVKTWWRTINTGEDFDKSVVRATWNVWMRVTAYVRFVACKVTHAHAHSKERWVRACLPSMMLDKRQDWSDLEGLMITFHTTLF